jgi:hypothetical protein
VIKEARGAPLRRTHQYGMAVHAHDWRNVLVAKGAAGLVNDLMQLALGDLVVLDELADHAEGQVGVRQCAPRLELRRRHGRHAVGHEQPPIPRQTLHDDRPEVQSLLTPAGAAVRDRRR